MASFRCFSNYSKVVSDHFDKLLTATIHEPYSELNFTRKCITQRTAFSVPVVRSEHRLLELLMVRQSERQVYSFELRLSSWVDQNEAGRSETEFSFTFQFSHALDLDLELDSESLETKMFPVNPKRIERSCDRWV